MEKILKLYTYIDGINDTPFPSEEYQVVTSNFRSDYKRMGGAPSITCTIMHPMCLDKLWTYGVYAKFNGERFFIKQIPSSSYDNTDARYKHELELVSERIILDNVYVYDVVDSASVDDKPVSNNSKFTFFGTVNEFAQRLNHSLRYSGLDYTIVVDDGITSDGKLVSFENQFFTNALQEIYNIFELPYYFVGKVIHIGYTSNAITHTFKYGQDESLLSIQKQNANHKIVNRVTGVGSSDNIPYYYPNDDEKGETEVLYNNKKDIAYVSNQSKYKKVKLSDIFKYSYAKSYNKTLVDEKGRSSNGYLVLVGENVFEIGNVTYPFKIESLSDTMFDINYLGDNLVDIKIDVFRGSEQLMSTSKTGSFSRRYREGNYELRITLHVHIEGVNIESEVNVDDVLKDISLHVYQQTEYKDSWLLNDREKVNLFDYGLSINGTPSNGDTITFKRVGYIQPQTNLMPSIYRDSLGKERFYNALNGTYVSPETDEYYEFENQYVEGQPREHIVNFENVKPSIVGMKNASNQRIDMFLEFAYDENDNDEFDEEGNYLHPYFFAKLRKFDGEYGFNLFDHAIDEDEMVIAMTSGSCGACEFIIGVTEDTQKNIVQVNEYGNLKRDDKGNVIRSGTPQDRQNDTRNNEVWIALKKDINTFGVIMPNAEYKYRPSTDDTFVILHIDLPKAYILAAENNLKEQLIKYMSVNNVEKFNFSISFSRIFFAENPHILAQLDENARIQIEYDGIRHDLYVSSYSYNMSSDKALPEIKVELSDTISVQQNALQNAISEVKQDIMSSVGSADFLKQGLQYFLRKDTNDRTRGKLSSDVGFEVGKYVSGASGAIIYQDKESGQTIGELDKLYVRMKAYFETLEIVNVNTIGGKQILSPAGSIKCIGVEETSNAYRCYFLAEQDGEKVGNRWKIGDQAYSQIFNAKTGVSNKVSNTYYWRLVVGVTTDAIDFDGKQCHYIELSKTDCDNGSDIPMVGDVINHRGSRTDIDRMNLIEWSSVDAFSPNITLFHGVNSYSLDGKAYVDFGVDKTLNKAYMNVYGDMYVGDRKEEQYIRYENGKVTIKGKLEVGTTLSDGRDLEQAIKDAAPEGYDEFVEQVTKEFEAIRNEMDGAIDTWFGDETPTLSNYPAIDWITDSDKDSHLGDLFYANDGKAYRFQYTQEKGYHWATIDDSEVVKALELAQKALDTADGKRRVFIDKPYPPYDLGDLWAGGSDTPLKRCVKAKSENGSYSDSDWALADDSHAYADAVRNDLEQSISTTTSSLNSAIQNVESASKTYTDTAKQALQTSINELNNAKANVNDVYSKSEADSEISKAEKAAIDAANKQAQAAIELSETTIKAYADGVVDEEEAARIKQAQENLDEAKRYAEKKAQEAFNSASEQIGSFDYLKAALKESTSIEQGLVQTSLLQLGYTSNGKFVPMSGTNGIYDNSSHGGGVASWWGGGLHDLLDYYDWDGNDWVVKSGKTPPTNLPSGLIRFDGTGYLAKGKFWWDNNGKIYADPTALFLMFDVEDEAKSLSATILSILDKQKEFEDMWLIKKDANGNEYIYSKYHIATQYGMTMYGDATTLNIPSIYNGLPIDGSTIYWENGVLKAKGGEGGGGADSVAWANITGKPTWIGSSKPIYSYSEITGAISTTELQNYLTQNAYLNVTSGDNRYLKLSGGTISLPTFSPLNIVRESTLAAAIGFHNSTGKLGNLGFNDTSGPKWFDTSYTEFSLLHSGNYYNYALPLSGGEISGTGLMPLTINTSNSGIEILLKCKSNTKVHVGWSMSDGVFMQEGESEAYIGVQPNKTPYYFNGTRYTLWHEGNFTPSNYLPLSGGTLDGVLTLRASNSSSDSWIEFSNKGNSVVHKLGVRRPESTYGLQYYNGSEYYKIWHEGNDGSGSRLDADLLDGQEEATFAKWKSGIASSGEHRHIGYAYGGNGWITSGAAMSFGASENYFMQIQGGGNKNKDVFLYARYIYEGIYSDWKTIAFTDSNVASATYSLNTSKLYSTDIIYSYGSANPYYGYLTFNNTYGEWDFKVSPNTPEYIHVYSSDKLRTTRTIWGQSFDGTGNVSGELVLGSSYITGFQGINILDAKSSWVILGEGTNAKSWTTYINGYNINFRCGSGGTSGLYIDSKDRVGIGTTSPAKKLHIYDSNISNDSILLLEKGNTYDSRLELINTVDSLSIIQQSTGNAFVSLRGNHSLIFETSNSSRLTIDSSGNVGIGTTSPSSLLQVYGDGRISDIHFREAYMNLNRDGATSAIYDSTKTALEIEATSGVSILRTYNVTRQASIVLHTNGNIGIGTLSPSAKLHVAGNFQTNDVWIGSDTGTYIEGTQTGGLRIQYANSDKKYTQIHLKDLTVTINNNLLCSGGITMYSDQRKKTILNHVELSLKQIADAPLIEHYYNSDESKTTHVGSIAQYWAEMNDWFCKLDSEGYYTMEIQNAALASAISVARELVKFENETDKRIRLLEEENKELRNEIELLKAS